MVSFTFDFRPNIIASYRREIKKACVGFHYSGAIRKQLPVFPSNINTPLTKRWLHLLFSSIIFEACLIEETEKEVILIYQYFLL